MSNLHGRSQLITSESVVQTVFNTWIKHRDIRALLVLSILKLGKCVCSSPTLRGQPLIRGPHFRKRIFFLTLQWFYFIESKCLVGGGKIELENSAWPLPPQQWLIVRPLDNGTSAVRDWAKYKCQAGPELPLWEPDEYVTFKYLDK